MPKPPRRDCRKKDRWAAYYDAMGFMYEMGAHACQPGSRCKELAQRDATKFYAGAREIREGKHPRVLDGTWK